MLSILSALRLKSAVGRGERDGGGDTRMLMGWFGAPAEIG